MSKTGAVLLTGFANKSSSLAAFFTAPNAGNFCRLIETDSGTNTSARNNAFVPVQGGCLVVQCKTIVETNTNLGILARTVCTIARN